MFIFADIQSYLLYDVANVTLINVFDLLFLWVVYPFKSNQESVFAVCFLFRLKPLELVMKEVAYFILYLSEFLAVFCKVLMAALVNFLYSSMVSLNKIAILFLLLGC